jgi:hypothetical protein
MSSGSSQSARRVWQAHHPCQRAAWQGRYACTPEDFSVDSVIASAARALAVGDVLAALRFVALRSDPHALALRGIAMARLGDYARSRQLLREAALGFGTHEEISRARCVVAEAEVALATRDLRGSTRTLAAAIETLESNGDRGNALQGRLTAARRLLLLGRLDEVGQMADTLSLDGAAPPIVAVSQLLVAELELRSLRIAKAEEALSRAHEAATRSGVPALLAEVEQVRAALSRPAARRLHATGEEAIRLEQVAAILGSGALVIDACRRGIGLDGEWRSLARRPIPFALARSLARAWPAAVDRETLVEDVFLARRADETHRARLRVEIGRLRALVKGIACIDATERGFAIRSAGGKDLVLLLPPFDGDQASLIALLSDGSAWSTPALALALGASERTVQRALAELETSNRANSVGNARARRWVAPPLSGITTILLLPTLTAPQ